MLLQVKNLTREFKVQHGLFKSGASVVRALDDVSFTVNERSCLGIVGESGSGKTTLARIILGLIRPTSGELLFNKELISNFRKDVRIIFQNPYASLDPRMRIRDAVAEPLIVHKAARRRDIAGMAEDLLLMVGLDKSALDRFPHEFSGGQRQRICIARALAGEPRCVILDEPVSSLDLTIQAEMLDLFLRLKEQFKLTYLFISHNLALVRHIADSVIVMEKGKIVEQGSLGQVFANPQHQYTKTLLKAAGADKLSPNPV